MSANRNMVSLPGIIFPSFGSPYETADHYWSMSNITKGRTLEDSRGAAHSTVRGGAKIKKVYQIGNVLYLDGIDAWVDTGN